MTADRVERLLDRLRKRAPARHRLAVALSCASRIDQPLLRRVRLELVPEADSADEIELWFGPLAARASVEGFAFEPAVAAALREELKAAPVLLQAVAPILEASHAHLSPALRLEERLAWMTLSGATDAAIDLALAPALKALSEPGREALASWVVRAIPALPEQARGRPIAQRLLGIASLMLRGATGLPGEDGGERLDWRRYLEIDPRRTLELYLWLIGDRLLISGTLDREGAAQTLSIPYSTPPMLQVEWQAEGQARFALLLLDKGLRGQVEGIGDEAVLGFADGGRARVRRLAGYEHPDGAEQPVNYQIAKVVVLEGDLSDAAGLARVLSNGETGELFHFDSLPMRKADEPWHESEVSERDMVFRPCSKSVHGARPQTFFLRETAAILIARTLEGGDPDDVAGLIRWVRGLNPESFPGNRIPTLAVVGVAGSGVSPADIQHTHERLLALAKEQAKSGSPFDYFPHAESVDDVCRGLVERIDWSLLPGTSEPLAYERIESMLPGARPEHPDQAPLGELLSALASEPDLSFTWGEREHLQAIRLAEAKGRVRQVGTEQERYVLAERLYESVLVAVLERATVQGKELGLEMARVDEGLTADPDLASDSLGSGGYLAVIDDLVRLGVLSRLALSDGDWVAVPWLDPRTPYRPADRNSDRGDLLVRAEWDDDLGDAFFLMACYLSREDLVGGPNLGSSHLNFSYRSELEVEIQIESTDRPARLALYGDRASAADDRNALADLFVRALAPSLPVGIEPRLERIGDQDPQAADERDARFRQGLERLVRLRKGIDLSSVPPDDPAHWFGTLVDRDLHLYEGLLTLARDEKGGEGTPIASLLVELEGLIRDAVSVAETAPFKDPGILARVRYRRVLATQGRFVEQVLSGSVPVPEKLEGVVRDFLQDILHLQRELNRVRISTLPADGEAARWLLQAAENFGEQGWQMESSEPPDALDRGVKAPATGARDADLILYLVSRARLDESKEDRDSKVILDRAAKFDAIVLPINLDFISDGAGQLPLPPNHFWPGNKPFSEAAEEIPVALLPLMRAAIEMLSDPDRLRSWLEQGAPPLRSSFGQKSL